MFAISPTDYDWFQLLKTNQIFTNVNFWTPTPWNISGLSNGDKLYFMLKSPYRKIGGLGIFQEYKNCSTDKAWNEFGIGNGCASKLEMVERLNEYRSKNSNETRSSADSDIGCIVLSNIELWDEEEWIDLENTDIDFSKNIVKIKYFNVLDTLSTNRNEEESGYVIIDMSSEKLKSSRMIAVRKGQGHFRLIVGKAYKNRCCISGEEIPELLEAAHIQPYINESSNHIQNGLLLRTDWHKLYDNNLVYIDENYGIRISPDVTSQYYLGYNGSTISVPIDQTLRPSVEALRSREAEFRN